MIKTIDNKKRFKQLIKKVFSNRDANGIPYGYPKGYNDIVGEPIYQQDSNKQMVFEVPSRVQPFRMKPIKVTRLAKGGPTGKPTFNDSLRIYNNYKDLLKSVDSLGYSREQAYMDTPELDNSTTWNDFLKRTQINQNEAAIKDNYEPLKVIDDNGLLSFVDFVQGIINPDIERQLVSPNILPESAYGYRMHGAPKIQQPNTVTISQSGYVPHTGENDARKIYSYDNVVRDIDRMRARYGPNYNGYDKLPRRNTASINKMESLKSTIPSTSTTPNITPRPLSVTNTTNISPNTFFQYNPDKFGGKYPTNNYINWGEGQGRETLSQQDADNLYKHFNSTGIGKNIKSNYAFAMGGDPLRSKKSERAKWREIKRANKKGLIVEQEFPIEDTNNALFTPKPIKNNDMKNITFRKDNKVYRIPRKSFGGILSIATRLYDSAYAIGDSMIKNNLDEYGLIDNRSTHRTTLGLQSVFDPLGAGIQTIKEGDVWGGLSQALLPGISNLWMGNRTADRQYEADAKTRVKIQQDQLNANRVAGYNMRGGMSQGKDIVRFKDGGNITTIRNKNRVSPSARISSSLLGVQSVPSTLYDIDLMKCGGMIKRHRIKGKSLGGVAVENATVTPIGKGMQLNALTRGTDTIPATVDGQPVLLDDKEVIVSDRMGRKVVISDDLGEVSKYKAEVATARNDDELQYIADKYAARAIRKSGGNRGPTGSKGWGGNSSLGTSIDVWANNYKANDAYSKGYADSLASTNTGGSSFDYNTIGTIGNIGLGIANRAINESAKHRLDNVKFPINSYAARDRLDIDVNRAPYEQAMRSNRLSANEIMEKYRRYNPSAAAAILPSVTAGVVEGGNNLTANYMGNRSQLSNMDVDQENRTRMYNTQSKNIWNMAKYGDSVNRIQTDLNLNANSLNYGQRIFNNAMQYYQDQEKFKAIAASYGVTINGNETIDEIRAKFLQSMTNNIKGPQ